MERSRVGLSVCLSVRPFVVCPIVRQQERRATGLLLSALRAGYRSIAGAGAQQQRRRSTALGIKHGQCHVDSRVDEAEHKLVQLFEINLLNIIIHNSL